MSGRANNERIEFVVQNLVAKKAAYGLRGADFADASARLGVPISTLRRWVEKGTSVRKKRSSFETTDLHDAIWISVNGNSASLRRELVTAMEEAGGTGSDVRSLRTIQRAIAAKFHHRERVYARKGDAGRRNFTLALSFPAPHRNGRWYVDHVLLPVWLKPLRGKEWVKLWLTAVEDAHSRLIMGWVVSLQPNEAVVLAALRCAILRDPDCGPGYGIPVIATWDNAPEFLASGVEVALGDLGTICIPAPPWVPEHKGPIERWFQTLEKEKISTLPFYAKGQRDRRGRVPGLTESQLTIQGLTEIVRDYIRHYNNERPHSQLAWRTPAAVWEADPTDVQQPPEPEQLSFLLMRVTKKHKMKKDGIQFLSHRYYAPEMAERVGEWFHLRYVPGDERQVWVFDGDELICVAEPFDATDDALTDALRNARQKANVRTNELRKEADKILKAKYAPSTSGALVDTSIVDQGEADDMAAVLADAASTETGRRLGRDYEGKNQPLPIKAKKPTA